MNVRKRLLISNTLMVVVPAVVAAVVGVVCLGLVWLWAAGGTIAGSEMLEESVKATMSEQVGISDLKALLVLAALVVVAVVIVVAVLANRFVTRFVIDNVTGPLDLLSVGVERIREGDLDYRIGYQGNDEFREVCDAFDEMAERLQSSVERDWQTDQARKQLIAGFSHDIRSPLTCIKGYAEGLRDGVADTPEARNRYVGMIVQKVDDISRMSSRMLELAKLDMESYAVELKPINLREYIESYVAENRDDLEQRGVHVGLSLKDAWVEASKAELDAIMGNIIENSVRYRTKDTSALHICTSSVDGRCLLSVSDDGPGVAAQDLPQLFEPLFRADAARAHYEEGSGLGLALVAAWAKAMGTAVSACESPEGGLTVELSFPQLLLPEEGEA